MPDSDTTVALILESMASPIAHSLAGVIVYFACKRDHPFQTRELLIVVLAANVADLDLIPGLLLGDESLFHRSISHSLLAAGVMAAVAAALLAWWRYPRAGVLTVMIALALASQLLIDYLSFDDSAPQGFPLLWPFSDRAFMSEQTVFLNVRRDHLFTATVIMHNFKAALLELAIMAPPAWVAWYWRRQRDRTA